MKRVTYISRFARDLSREEIRQLGQVAERNNSRDSISGVLICSSGVFFQTIEGDGEKIDRLFEKIKNDDRHKDLLCLKTEIGVRERQFPDWSMKTLNLDENTDILMHPIRSLFQVLAESYGILEKYTQPAVLKLISDGINPLAVPSQVVPKVILFCDIVAFSYFSAVLSIEEIVALVNTYLSICSETIAKRGGEVTKYIGDCVMAYFGYDRADDAIEASLEILSQIQREREGSPVDSPFRFLHTGIGIAGGEVIEGNIGSAHKKEFTVLGDSVNQAAFLEALTRKLPRSLALSSEIKGIASNRWPLVPLGEFDMKRGQDPIPVFSVDLPSTLRPSDPQEIVQQVNQNLELENRRRYGIANEE